MHGRLQSIEKTLAGILGALPPTADADDSIPTPTSNAYSHTLPLSFALGPEGQTLDFLSAVQGKQIPSDGLEQDADTSLPLSDNLEEAADIVNTTSIQGKQIPSDSLEQDVDTSLPLSDGPEEAADITNTTSGQEVKADNIRELFGAFPEVLQHLIDAATVVEYVGGLLKDRDVHIIIAVLVVGTVLSFVLYDLCIYIQYDIIPVQ